MKHYEGLVRSTVHDLLDALHKREGQKIDISAWMTFFGYVALLTGAILCAEYEVLGLILWATWRTCDWMSAQPGRANMTSSRSFSYDFGMLKNGRDIHGLSHLIENALMQVHSRYA